MANNRKLYEEAMRRGEAYLSAEDWQNAFKAYRVAVGEFPKHPTAYAGLGEACVGLKQLPRALDCYKLAARYSRGNMDHLRKVADIQERMGMLSDAGRTYLAVGELLLQRRDLDTAISNWERATRLEPTLLGAHKRLAMVFQRQGKLRDAVREYLAIARILQMTGDKRKALQMCKAALRLDPENQDVITAVKLIQYGEEAFPDQEPEPEEIGEPEVVEEEDSLAETVRQMAAIFAKEQQEAQRKEETAVAGPLDVARRQAENQLNGEILREEEEKDLVGDRSLSKLERDALIGQAMDFEFRGHDVEAIRCYEQAINGGLELPAAYFVLGMLYLRQNRQMDARQMFQMAAIDSVYADGVRAALSSNLKQ